MKMIAVLAGLLCTLPVLAAGPEDRPRPEGTPASEEKDEWPQKGDDAFLTRRATLRLRSFDLLRAAIPYTRLSCDNTAYCTYTYEPCESLSVQRTMRGDHYVFLDIRDAPGLQIGLAGEWRKVLFPTLHDCLQERRDPTPVSFSRGKWPTLFEVGSQSRTH